MLQYQSQLETLPPAHETQMVENQRDTCWMIEDGFIQAMSGWDDATPCIFFELELNARRRI